MSVALAWRSYKRELIICSDAAIAWHVQITSIIYLWTVQARPKSSPFLCHLQIIRESSSSGTEDSERGDDNDESGREGGADDDESDKDDA